MSFSNIPGSLLPTLDLLLPTVIIIAVGYSLARWAQLSTAPLYTLLRFIFFPVFLFMTLEERMSFEMFFFGALIGAGVVVFGFLIHMIVHRVATTTIDISLAIPNVACFSIPLFALSWEGRGLGTACAFFAGASLAAFFLEKKEITKLFKEPWLYAVVAGLLLKGFRAPIMPLFDILALFKDGTYPLLLLFLGASLYPFEGLTEFSAWATAGLRVAGGFGVALLGVTFLPVSPALAAGAVMVAMAPPATGSLSLAGSAEDTYASRGPANVGLFLSLIVFIFFLASGWRPW